MTPPYDVRALTITFIVLSHAASLAFAVYTTQRSGVRTQVLLYAFLIDYILRLSSIRPLYLWSRSDRSWARAAASALSRRPARGEKPEPLVEQNSGRFLGLWGHLGLMALLSYFAFVLANVDADRQLGSDLATVLDDLDWAIVVGITYWVNALVTRIIVIDPSRAADEEFRIQHPRARNSRRCGPGWRRGGGGATDERLPGLGVGGDGSAARHSDSGRSPRPPEGGKPCALRYPL